MWVHCIRSRQARLMWHTTFLESRNRLMSRYTLLCSTGLFLEPVSRTTCLHEVSEGTRSLTGSGQILDESRAGEEGIRVKKRMITN